MIREEPRSPKEIQTIKTERDQSRPILEGEEQKQDEGTQKGQSTRQQQIAESADRAKECVEIPRGIRNAEENPTRR
jgi:hypothetical protein